MQDVIYVGIPIVFFAICVAYVRGLDRLVRSGEETERTTDVAEPAMPGGFGAAEAMS
ncbi:MAG: hypothetical protein WAS51_06265 [Ilumatobacteraceae bacterium]|nr:MAG: hypothetical protein IPM43_09875 [Actinomycetota bacterium]